MKRQLVSEIVVLVVLILFAPFNACFNVFAQGGDARLNPKPKPTPSPKAATKPPSRAPVTPTAVPGPVTPTLVFNQEVKDKLDLKSSQKIPTGDLYEEFILNAKTDDWLNFQIQSENPDLVVQLFDKEKVEVPLVRGGPSLFTIKTKTAGVPADGEYRVRVIGKAPTPFSLMVYRQGLTINAFDERFNKIYLSIRESDSASIDAAIAQFEELANDDGLRPMTYEQLALMYLYNRKDFDKAEKAMEQAIKKNGAAVVKVSFDSQWRRMGKLRGGRVDWEDARTGWLRIRPGQLVLTDVANRSLATLSGSQIKGLAQITTSNYHIITITSENTPRRPFLFLPGSNEKAETDLVVKLIQTYVMKQ